MPRKERYPHYVHTRKEHKCAACGKVIPKGTLARYKNTLTGVRDYYHEWPRCSFV